MTRSLAFTLLSALFLALSLALVYVTQTDPAIHHGPVPTSAPGPSPVAPAVTP